MVRPEAALRVTGGYSSAQIWAQAVEAAGTTDGVPVAQALHSGTFRVFGIEARFDAYGNMQGPLGEPALWVGGTASRCPELGSKIRSKSSPSA